MDIMNELIDQDKFEYKCFDELKKLMKSNPNFRNIIENGVLETKISRFGDDLWEKIKNQNIRRINNFEDVFIAGANIGYCTVAAKQLSYSLDECYICGGVLPILIGTKNCPDGSHTWISYNNKIIDTTLMLEIDEDYAKKIGYIEENIYNPNIDPIYTATKNWTNDNYISKKR